MQERLRRRGETVYLDRPGRSPRRGIFHIEAGLTEQQLAAVDMVLTLANIALNARSMVDHKVKAAYPQR